MRFIPFTRAIYFSKRPPILSPPFLVGRVRFLLKQTTEKKREIKKQVGTLILISFLEDLEMHGIRRISPTHQGGSAVSRDAQAGFSDSGQFQALEWVLVPVFLPGRRQQRFSHFGGGDEQMCWDFRGQ